MNRKETILPVGNCPIVEMVPRELYEEAKKQTADAMVLVSDLKENLTEMVDRRDDLLSELDYLEEKNLELKNHRHHLVVERDNLKVWNHIYFTCTISLGLTLILLVLA